MFLQLEYTIIYNVAYLNSGHGDCRRVSFSHKGEAIPVIHKTFGVSHLKRMLITSLREYEICSQGINQHYDQSPKYRWYFL